MYKLYRKTRKLRLETNRSPNKFKGTLSAIFWYVKVLYLLSSGTYFLPKSDLWFSQNQGKSKNPGASEELKSGYPEQYKELKTGYPEQYKELKPGYPEQYKELKTGYPE